jgi:hypothetical protein
MKGVPSCHWLMAALCTIVLSTVLISSYAHVLDVSVYTSD